MNCLTLSGPLSQEVKVFGDSVLVNILTKSYSGQQKLTKISVWLSGNVKQHQCEAVKKLKVGEHVAFKASIGNRQNKKTQAWELHIYVQETLLFSAPDVIPEAQSIPDAAFDEEIPF